MDPYTGEPEIDFQGTDTQKQFRYKNGISGKLSFEQVNEITWKLGEMTNVPRVTASEAATAPPRQSLG
jgi:hypothetical protein